MELCLLAGPGAARDQDVLSKPQHRLEDRHSRPVDRAEAYELVPREAIPGKLADSDARPPVVTGIHDDVDAALVGQPGIEDWLAGIETAGHLAADRLGR